MGYKGMTIRWLLVRPLVVRTKGRGGTPRGYARRTGKARSVFPLVKIIVINFHRRKTKNPIYQALSHSDLIRNPLRRNTFPVFVDDPHPTPGVIPRRPSLSASVAAFRPLARTGQVPVATAGALEGVEGLVHCPHPGADSL